MSTNAESIHQQLCRNALSFLQRAVDEVGVSPSFSIVHFAIGIELLLKSRLVLEHWSLIVDGNKANWSQFKKGQCRTVSLDESMRRLDEICCEPIPSLAKTTFRALAAHRNRIVHFFHEIDAEPNQARNAAIIEQFKCWYYIRQIFEKWREHFPDLATEIWSIQKTMNSNRNYLAEVFEHLSPAIKGQQSDGQTFCECQFCGFHAAKENAKTLQLGIAICEVCGSEHNYLFIECPTCSFDIRVTNYNINDITCNGCGTKLSNDELGETIDSDPVNSDNYFEHVGINCAACLSLGSVVDHHDHFVCKLCLGIATDAPMCGWCGERQIGGGDLVYSRLHGCEFCDGQLGWEGDG
ncbi:MAG: hypothetical protein GC150_16390 [Rhizobiales bacterium]|nr:hypothetical protein [Hyphomicrobiales bacterium]